jgi:uncharacterized membrane protein (DUF485 family)
MQVNAGRFRLREAGARTILPTENSCGTGRNDVDDRTISRIRKNPKFVELERRRNGFSWTLCILMLAIYYGFIALVAFAPGLMARTFGEGSVLTLGFPLGLGVILSAVVLTGIYVWRANSEFDRLTRDVVESAR